MSLPRKAYTRAEAAQVVGVSESTITGALKSGELRGTMIKSKVVIGVKELDEWFDALPTFQEDL